MYTLATVNSVLHNIDVSEVRHDPFPHVLIQDALDEATCTKLMQEFPSAAQVTKGAPEGSNLRFDYTIKDARSDSSLSSFALEFLESQASPEFLADFVRLFETDLERFYPEFLAEYRKGMQSGIRAIDSFETHGVLLDAHYSINTPVTGKGTSVRSAHVDHPQKLYGGLLYLRHPEDDSVGGDLVLYRYRKGVKDFTQHPIRFSDIEEVDTIPYARNVLVLFLNTNQSVHGVTVREETRHQRTFVNFVGELPTPLFRRRKQPSLLDRAVHKLESVFSARA